MPYHWFLLSISLCPHNNFLFFFFLTPIIHCSRADIKIYLKASLTLFLSSLSYLNELNHSFFYIIYKNYVSKFFIAIVFIRTINLALNSSMIYSRQQKQHFLSPVCLLETFLLIYYQAAEDQTALYALSIRGMARNRHSTKIPSALMSPVRRGFVFCYRLIKSKFGVETLRQFGICIVVQSLYQYPTHPKKKELLQTFEPIT